MEFKLIELADGGFQIVPGKTVVLNPERLGKARCALFCWFAGMRRGRLAPTLKEALEGGGQGELCLFLTDAFELAYPGVDGERRSGEFKDMLERMRGMLPDGFHAGEPWSFAYCLCDCTDATVPVCFSGKISSRHRPRP